MLAMILIGSLVVSIDDPAMLSSLLYFVTLIKFSSDFYCFNTTLC